MICGRGCARLGTGNKRACTTFAASVGLVPVSAIAISAAIAAAAGAAVIASAAASASVTTAAAAASDCCTVAISLRENIPGVPLTWHDEREKGQGSIIDTNVTGKCK